jgi:hypothetical protein
MLDPVKVGLVGYYEDGEQPAQAFQGLDAQDFYIKAKIIPCLPDAK